MEHENAVVIITGANFNAEVLDNPGLVVLDFWAPWCAPCKALAPTFHALADELAGKAVFGKVNVDNETELARRFGVRGIPNLVAIRNGKLVSQKVGVLNAVDLRAWLDELLVVK